MGVILPKDKVEVTKPLIFLAGPISCAPYWQSEAVKIIHHIKPEVLVASPSKYMDEENQNKIILDGREDAFHRQRAWEMYYMDMALEKGALMFWLPRKVNQNHPNYDSSKVYGAITRMELGETFIKYQNNNSLRFCIGTDGNFSDFSTIQYDLETYAPRIKIHCTLEETCREAINLIL